jgi:hypothetical protein
MRRLPRPSWRTLPKLDATDLGLIALTLAIKAGLLVLGVVATQVAWGWTPGLLGPWDQWDAPHYTDLAVFGYRAEDPGNLVGPDGYRQVFPGDLDLYIVFFPLFPWLTGAVNVLTRDPVVAAFIVSGLASLVVGPLLRRVVAVELGDGIGTRAAVFLLIFPTAFFLHIGYTESLFLALVLAAFWFARTDRWWLAGLVAILAGLTRVNGLLLIPALAVEALLQWRADPDRRWRWRWLASGGAAVGFAGYLVLNQAVYGDPVAFLAIQDDHWDKALAWPWDGVAGVLRWFEVENLDLLVIHGVMELAFVGLGLAGIVAAVVLRFRPSWTTWMAANLVLFVSTGFVLSVPRYALVLFGLFAWFALLSRRWPVGVALVLASVALLGWLAARFATTQWAF